MSSDSPPAKREKREKPRTGPPVTRSLLEEIDRENTEKINSMSKEEILQAQKELTQTLDPSLIEALKRLGRAKQNKEPLYILLFPTTFLFPSLFFPPPPSCLSFFSSLPLSPSLLFCLFSLHLLSFFFSCNSKG